MDLPLSCPIRLILAALGLLVFAGQAVAQETRVAAAADADVIAIYSEHVERRLLRAHVDRAAGRISLVPFGPPGVDSFAVAPNGAFIVTSATHDQAAGNPVTDLFLLDEAGHALGQPLRSPVGAIAGLAISPKGDRIAVSSNRGWLALLAVEGNGQARRLAVRAEIGVSADRQFTYAFRPDGGLVTMVDDWVATYRSNDGTVQRTLDLKTIKTILGYKHRPKNRRRTKRSAEWEVAVERPTYDLTIFKLHCGKLTLKIYTKGERVLRIEVVAHNTRELNCGRSLDKFPEVVSRLKSVLERFADALSCIDQCFIADEMLEQLPAASRVGKTIVGGIDLNKARMRRVIEALLALSSSPNGFTASEVAARVRALSKQSPSQYGPRHAAYDLKKLRGKHIIRRIGHTRRY